MPSVRGALAATLVLATGAIAQGPPPTVTLPPAVSVPPGRFTVAGTGADPQGGTLTYSWSLQSGVGFQLPPAGQPTPTLTAFTQAPGARTLQLLAHASPSGLDSAPATTTLTILDLPPIATAHGRVVCRPGDLVTLSAALSSDPNDTTLRHQWLPEAPALAQVEGPTTGATLQYRALTAGLHAVGLVVKDAVSSSPPATFQVLALGDAPTANQPPIAQVAAPARANAWTVFQLDGRFSHDPDADALRFLWAHESGPEVLVDDPAAPQPRVMAVAPGTLVLALRLEDSAGHATTHRTTISILPTGEAPLIEPIRVPDCRTSAPCKLPAAPAGGAHPSHQWQWSWMGGVAVQLEPGGTLEPATPPSTGVLIGLREGLARVRATVSDPGSGRTASEEVEVAIRRSPGKLPDLVAAAPAISVLGEEVTLDASASQGWLVISGSEPAPIAASGFFWEQTGGQPAVLRAPDGTVDPSKAVQRFTPPAPGWYRFRVIAYSGDQASVPADLELRVLSHHPADNVAPIADAGDDALDAPAGTPLWLDGTGSSDADPYDTRYLRYRWRVIAFPTAQPPSLEGELTQRPRFIPEAGSYAFELVVSDGDKESAPAVVHVIARAESPLGCASVPGPLAGGGVALGCALWAARRRRGLQRLAVICAALLVCGRASAQVRQGVTELEEARRLYASFQLGPILPLLERAAASPDLTAPERAQVYELRALTYAALDDTAAEEESFLQLLAVWPDYRPARGTSTKVRAVFERALELHRARQEVRLSHHSPVGSDGRVTTTLDVTVTSASERVATMTVHYRLQGTPSFSQSSMRRGDQGVFSAAVPNLFPGPSARRTLEYFLRARDANGGYVAGVGDEQAPLQLQIDTVPLQRPPPLYQNPIVWGVAGAVAVAVAGGVLLASQPAPVGRGSQVEHLR